MIGFAPRVTGALAAALLPAAAFAGSLDRLKGGSEHARERAAGGPAHLWVGVALLGALVVVIAAAAWWSRTRRRRPRGD